MSKAHTNNLCSVCQFAYTDLFGFYFNQQCTVYFLF